MGLIYNKLWKILIDKGMKKTDLRLKTGMSQATLAKLVLQIRARTSKLTGSSLLILAIVDEAIFAANSKSFFFIFLSISSFQSLLYESVPL